MSGDAESLVRARTGARRIVSVTFARRRSAIPESTGHTVQQHVHNRGGWTARAWLVCLGTALAFVAWFIGGALGLVDLAIYAAAVAPGLPVGFALFGRAHPAAWIAGAIVGYAVTAVAVWGVIALGVPHVLGFIAIWMGLALMAVAVSWRLGAPLVTLPAWTARDMAALTLVLLLVPALFALPYGNLGARDAEGTRYYRAYFTADFVWHTALVAELTKFSMPPRNPYMWHRPMQYYWTYFMVPTAMVALSPGDTADVQRALKISALGTGVLFTGAIFIAAWAAVPVACAAALGTVLAVTAASAEGIYAIFDLLSRGASLELLRDLNIDAMTAWHFRGLRVDSLARSMWYNPQHSMAAALGILVFPIVARAGTAVPLAAVVLAGVALGGATAFNPLIGGMFSLAYGAAVLLTARRARHPLGYVLRSATAAIPVAVALAWCVHNNMVEGAGDVVHFGLTDAARSAPIITLILSIGPILLPTLVVLWPYWRMPREVWAPAIGLLLAVLLFYFVALTVESSYVGFRAGQLMQICLAVLLARALTFGIRGGRLTAPGAALVLLISVTGLPTTVIDLYNAQDISNLAMGPGFRWTVTTTAAEQEAFDWIRRETPPGAIVQMNAHARHPETWSFIPTFAERRMAAGMPISMISIPEYERESRFVETMYTTAIASEAHYIAQSLLIEYIFVGRVERQQMSLPAREKFQDPRYFAEAFRNSEVTIYTVR